MKGEMNSSQSSYHLFRLIKICPFLQQCVSLSVSYCKRMLIFLRIKKKEVAMTLVLSNSFKCFMKSFSKLSDRLSGGTWGLRMRKYAFYFARHWVLLLLFIAFLFKIKELYSMIHKGFCSSKSSKISCMCICYKYFIYIAIFSKGCPSRICHIY